MPTHRLILAAPMLSDLLRGIPAAQLEAALDRAADWAHHAEIDCIRSGDWPESVRWAAVYNAIRFGQDVHRIASSAQRRGRR